MLIRHTNRYLPVGRSMCPTSGVFEQKPVLYPQTRKFICYVFGLLNNEWRRFLPSEGEDIILDANCESSWTAQALQLRCVMYVKGEGLIQEVTWAVSPTTCSASHQVGVPTPGTHPWIGCINPSRYNVVLDLVTHFDTYNSQLLLNICANKVLLRKIWKCTFLVWEDVPTANLSPIIPRACRQHCGKQPWSVTPIRVHLRMHTTIMQFQRCNIRYGIAV